MKLTEAAILDPGWRNEAAFAALGGEGQIILVDPPSRTVIVKLSHVPVGPAGDAIQKETFSFLKAILRWKPGTRSH